MLKYTGNPDSQHLLFTALLVFSIALHALLLSQLKWQIRLPEKTETIFEVELLQPEPKIVPPKPLPEIVKPAPDTVKKEKPRLVEQQQAPKPQAGIPEAAPQPPPVPEQKPAPVKPVPKPMLNIQSDVAGAATLQGSDLPVGEHTPRRPVIDPLIMQVTPPESLAEEERVIPEKLEPAPELSLDPEQLQRAPGNDILDTRQIAGSTPRADIRAEIRSKKDAVTYRVVEQSGAGTSPIRGSHEAGEHAIEGELSRRKVIKKPEPPVVNLERDVTITLKFTVLPTGEVDQIFPFRKAGSELEQLAVRLLRQYRFEPLFENDKIQQGIIHFTIYRNR